MDKEFHVLVSTIMLDGHLKQGKSTIVVQTSMVSDPIKWFCHVGMSYKIDILFWCKYIVFT